MSVTALTVGLGGESYQKLNAPRRFANYMRENWKMIVFVLILLAMYTAVGVYTIMGNKHGHKKDTNFSVEEVSAKFEQFIKDYSKFYKTDLEYQRRRAIFEANLNMFEEHNAKGLSYKLGITAHADMTYEEFLIGRTQPIDLTTAIKPEPFTATDEMYGDVPITFDWRKNNVVSEVLDQGECASGWAMAATASLESKLAIDSGDMVSLSAQQLVDCDHVNSKCKGGEPLLAYEYLSLHKGLCPAKEYPYTGVAGTCVDNTCSSATPYVYPVWVAQNEKSLKVAASNQPVAVSIVANSKFMHYKSGIFSDIFCSLGLVNHAALVVGYGVDADYEYYILKNSFGKDWGEDGYIRMAMSTVPLGQCQILAAAVYPKYINI